jgi:hypothetical protein
MPKGAGALEPGAMTGASGAVAGTEGDPGNQWALKTIVKPAKTTNKVQVMRFNVVSAVFALVNSCACPPIPPIPSPLGLWSNTRAIKLRAEADQITCTKLVIFISEGVNLSLEAKS